MTTKTIIVINGYPQVGKDTVVHNCEELLEASGCVVENISSIAPVWVWLKDMGADMDAKGPAERDLAATIKTALEKYDFLATRQTMADAQAEMNESIKLGFNHAVAFLHMREPDAIQFAKTICPEDTTNRVRNVVSSGQFAKTICPEDTTFLTLFVEKDTANKSHGNAADAGVEGMEYDLIIRNNGSLEDLKKSCQSLVGQILDIISEKEVAA